MADGYDRCLTADAYGTWLMADGYDRCLTADAYGTWLMATIDA